MIPGPGVPAPFSLSVEPGAVNVAQGSSATFVATLTRDDGFDAETTIALQDPPEGISGDTLIPQSLTPPPPCVCL
jgi:hypothetical protein